MPEQITVSLNDVLSARVGALALLNAPLPIKVTLRITQLSRQLKPHIEALETVRKNLLNEFAELTEAGDRIVSPSGETRVLPGFYEAWEAVRAETVIIERPVVLTPADFPEEVRGKPLEVPGIAFEQLGPFFAFEP